MLRTVAKLPCSASCPRGAELSGEAVEATVSRSSICTQCVQARTKARPLLSSVTPLSGGALARGVGGPFQPRTVQIPPIRTLRWPQCEFDEWTRRSWLRQTIRRRGEEGGRLLGATSRQAGARLPRVLSDSGATYPYVGMKFYHPHISTAVRRFASPCRASFVADGLAQQHP